MVRVSYHILAENIEKLFQKEISEDDPQAIEDHCIYIDNFIESCGWSTEEYFERWMQEPGN